MIHDCYSLDVLLSTILMVLFLIRWVWFSSFAARLDDMQNDTASEIAPRLRVIESFFCARPCRYI